MARIRVFLLLAFLAAIASASVPTFCKCTCFQNSTIIPLGPQHDPPPPPPKQQNPSSSITTSSSEPTSTSNPSRRAPHPLTPRAASSSCTQCNRAFCLAYNLPICKDAEETDVITSCFQRDSRKDQVIVWGFILGTAGLLGWAGVRKFVIERAQGQGQGQGMGIGLGQRRGDHGSGGQGSGNGGNGGRGGFMGVVSGLFGRGSNDNGGLFRRASGGAAGRGMYSPLEGDGGVARRPG